jgi:hypothetical protein
MYPYMGEYLRSIIASGRIEMEDIRAIRTVLSEETAIDRDLAEMLIEVDRSIAADARWRAFLAETIADLVVWVEQPLGKVTAEASAWLIGALRGPDGRVAPSAAVIVRAVVAEAEEADASLTMFALATPCTTPWAQPEAGARGSAGFVM